MSSTFHRTFTRMRFLLLAACALALASIPARAATGPCDILKNASPSTPCVAAFSTIRSLINGYTGPLYQITTSTGSTFDVNTLADGYADVSQQESSCAPGTCTITIIYDQTKTGHKLTPAPPGGAASGPGPNGYDLPAVADALPVQAGGHRLYGVYVRRGIGYRNNTTTGIPQNGAPEGVYMVASSSHVTNTCCYDFGNAESNNLDNGYGHMDALSEGCQPGTPCSPTVGLDVENGIIGKYDIPPTLPFVTLGGANDGQTTFHVWQGNAQSGSLSSPGAQTLPANYNGNMHQEGGIILGIGGDNSNGGIGNFFEGAMTSGTPTDATMNLVQANVVAVGYTGLLPYHDAFASGAAPGWTTYNGTWSVASSSYINTAVDTSGDKAVTGSPVWKDYTLQGDVNLTSGSGNAGLILRVTNPTNGTDALQGYYLGVTATNTLVLGRENNGWTQLKTATLPGSFSLNKWYHLTAQASGCTLTVSAQLVGATTVTGFTYTDTGCTFTAGAVGVRSFNAAAQWRDVNVATGTSSTLPYYAPFFNAGVPPTGWTNYNGTWSIATESYVNSSTTAAGDKSVSTASCTNCTVSGDVQLTTTAGDAGLLIRASNPTPGNANVNAYYLKIDSVGLISVFHESGGVSTEKFHAPLYESPVNAWFHVTAQLNGCLIRIVVQPVEATAPANDLTVSDCDFASGTVGIQNTGTSAKWRYISVIPN